MPLRQPTFAGTRCRNETNVAPRLPLLADNRILPYIETCFPKLPLHPGLRPSDIDATFLVQPIPGQQPQKIFRKSAFATRRKPRLNQSRL